MGPRDADTAACGPSAALLSVSSLMASLLAAAVAGKSWQLLTATAGLFSSAEPLLLVSPVGGQPSCASPLLPACTCAKIAFLKHYVLHLLVPRKRARRQVNLHV